MQSIEQRTEYLEEAVEALKMQNLVLAAAFKGLLRGLPGETAADAAESVRLALEDEAERLAYEDHPQADLFHDVTYDFFRERR